VERLLMYEKYQQAARLLLERPILFEDTFPRLNREELEILEDDISVALGNVSAEDLATFFRQACQMADETNVHLVQLERLSLQEHIQEVMDRLQVSKKGLWLRDLIDPAATRLRIIMLFLAILELARQRMIRLYQTDSYREIKIRMV